MFIVVDVEATEDLKVVAEGPRIPVSTSFLLLLVRHLLLVARHLLLLASCFYFTRSCSKSFLDGDWPKLATVENQAVGRTAFRQRPPRTPLVVRPVLTVSGRCWSPKGTTIHRWFDHL